MTDAVSQTGAIPTSPVEHASASGRVHVGDCLTVLRAMETASVDCIVTSPPYWSLRNYKVSGQIGNEPTPFEYVRNLVEVFEEAKRVLKDTGTLWLNLGDAYARRRSGDRFDIAPKNLMGLPWRVAFAIQDAGWILRSDIVWSKPNAMPENVGNRPTKSHEYVFMFAKGDRYHFDQDAVRQPHTMKPQRRMTQRASARDAEMSELRNDKRYAFRLRDEEGVDGHPGGRNIRTVWDVPTRAYRGAHFATFPEALITPCILAGCPAGGVVLDPFFGAGTTGVVAAKHGRSYIGIELNPDYAALAIGRIVEETRDHRVPSPDDRTSKPRTDGIEAVRSARNRLSMEAAQ